MCWVKVAIEGQLSGQLDHACAYAHRKGCHDGENRLIATAGASFLYDGDGQRVAATQNGVTTFYVGQHVEWSAGTLTRYIYAGAQRLAVKRGNRA